MTTPTSATSNTIDPVAATDAYFASVSNRSLVSSAEVIDHLLDVHPVVTGAALETVERYLRAFSGRELLSGDETTDALLDLRTALVG